MKSSLVLFAILGVAFAGALHDNFASKPLNVKDGVFDPLTKNGPEIQELNDPPQIVNGVYTVPLNHFDPVDGRRLSLVCTCGILYRNLSEDHTYFNHKSSVLPDLQIERGVLRDQWSYFH